MKAQDWMAMVRRGQQPVIELLPGAEKHDAFGESCLDRGMRARLVGARLDRNDHTIVVLSFDQGEFEEHNASFAQRNYYDKDGHPTLSAKQAGQYQQVVDGYFQVDDDLSAMIRDVPKAQTGLSLQEEFRSSGANGSYVDWLERQLVQARTQSNDAAASVDTRVDQASQSDELPQAVTRAELDAMPD